VEKLSDFCTIVSSIREACQELIVSVESSQYQKGFVFANAFKWFISEPFLRLENNSKYTFGVFRDPLDLLRQIATYIEENVCSIFLIIVFQDLQITKVGKLEYFIIRVIYAKDVFPLLNC
jgi:hypothetical protein